MLNGFGRLARNIGALIIGVLTVPSALPAQRYDVVFIAQPWEMGEVVSRIGEVPVPFGCQLAGCYPAPDEASDLGWGLSVSGVSLASVDVTLAGALPAALDLEGDVVRAPLEPDATLRFGSKVGGNGTRRGVARGLPRTIENPLARVRLNPRTSTESRENHSFWPDESEVIFEQTLGGVVVNSFRLLISSGRCRGLPAPGQVTDQFVLKDDIGGDGGRIILDARVEGGSGPYCRPNSLVAASSGQPIHNVLNMESCPQAKLTVFSDGDAMYFGSPTAWSDEPEAQPVYLAPPVDLPLAVWNASGVKKTLIEQHVALAERIYSIEETGIRVVLRAEDYIDVSNNEHAMDAIGSDCGNVVESEWYKPNQINVYYVNRNSGMWCRKTPNVLYIGQKPVPETLAHEIGHALLDTAFHACSLGRNNLMCPQSGGDLTMGQMFRMNVHTRSRLNKNGHRTGAVLACPSFRPSSDCPPDACHLW